MFRFALLAAPLLVLGAAAPAEVTQSSAAGFEISQTVTADAPIAQVW